MNKLSNECKIIQGVKMMDKIIAFCGLSCSGCPAFIATQKDNHKKREKTATAWSKMYKCVIKPEDINCDGCLEESGRLFNYCKVCEIRKCGQEKEVKNCAYCDDYACEKLIKFFDMAPEAKNALAEIKKNL
ncbi:MAG: DUF3795 domain-containing protein [Candidatus Atribacteria bacterium]|nr:DUF3795 domain-containing protein [Candidatus Atribacteria bacterium]